MHELWSSLNTLLADLQAQEKTQSKGDLVRAVRDTITQLVSEGEIEIKEEKISAYTRNLLIEHKVTVSDSYWSELFPSEQKRKYSKTSVAKNCEHEWEQQAETPEGMWERCLKCGIDQIDKITVAPTPQQTSKPEPVQEESVDTDEIVVLLERMKEISKNNTLIISTILQKTKMPTPSQVKLKLSKASTDEAKEQIQQKVNDSIEQARGRLSTVKHSLYSEKDPAALTAEIEAILAKQVQILQRFDDRQHVTYYERIMTYVAFCLGYDRAELAHLLNVSTKHVRQNITPHANSQTYLKVLGWLGRCPNPDCGITLKDTVESMIKYKGQEVSLDAKTDLKLADIEVEPLVPTGYQSRVVILENEIKYLKHKK